MRLSCLAAICGTVLLLSGCASGPAPKTYQLAPGVVVGQYSVQSVAIELNPELAKDTLNAAGATAAAQVIATRLENGLTLNYRNRMPVALTVIIDEYVENISTAQLMLVGGSYGISGRAILKDTDGTEVGTFQIKPPRRQNSGGLLGVVAEGATSTESIRNGLVEEFVTSTVKELYPTAR